MGQMTYAVMLGATWPKEHKAWPVVSGFKAGRGPDVETPSPDSTIVGIFVAGGENSGAPPLAGDIVLNRFEVTPGYAKRCEQAERQWARFHAYCAKRGIALPVAAYYLVQTEDA